MMYGALEDFKVLGICYFSSSDRGFMFVFFAFVLKLATKSIVFVE